MKQVGLHESWLNFLYEYVSPLQEHIFIGYNTSVRVIKHNFVETWEQAFVGCTSCLLLINALLHKFEITNIIEYINLHCFLVMGFVFMAL